MRIRMNDERKRRLKRLLEATGENTTGAIDVAVQHYLADLRAKWDVAPELDDALTERLSTVWLPIERETSVGRAD